MSGREKDGSGEARWDAAQEGAELLRDGERDAAIAELERVIEDDPRNEYAYFFLGSAHFDKGHFDKAMKASLKALELAPQYLGAMVQLGHSLRMLGRHGEAIRVARQLLAKNGDDGDALYLLGLCHYARGERAAAIEYLTRFLETRPELEVANEVNGLLQVLRGEVETRDDEMN
jgi:tetratricopeptide (TPR) repeat protein